MRAGLFLKNLREKIPLSQDQVADRTGLSKGGVSRIERVAETMDQVNGSTLTLLARVYIGSSASAEDLIELYQGNGRRKKKQNPPPYRGVQVIGSISAGGLVDFQDDRNGEFDELIPCPLEYAPDAFALRIVGDSMSPTYADGDRVIFTPIICDDVEAGEEVMVQLDGGGNGESTFKRAWPSSRKGWLLLVPLNSAHKPIEVDCTKVIRMARAVAIHRPIRRRP